MILRDIFCSGIFGAIASGVIIAPTFARAELSICNQTTEISNVAIAILTQENEAQSQGWWTIPPNRCEIIVRDILKTRYIYIYAIDVKGRQLISGAAPLCVGSRQFTIKGAQSCWMRGYDRASFAEIDTGSAPSWTVFLSELPVK